MFLLYITSVLLYLCLCLVVVSTPRSYKHSLMLSNHLWFGPPLGPILPSFSVYTFLASLSYLMRSTWPGHLILFAFRILIMDGDQFFHSEHYILKRNSTKILLQILRNIHISLRNTLSSLLHTLAPPPQGSLFILLLLHLQHSFSILYSVQI